MKSQISLEMMISLLLSIFILSLCIKIAQEIADKGLFYKSLLGLLAAVFA